MNINEAFSSFLSPLNVLFKKTKIYIFNITWEIAETIFRLLINFLITILIARYFGPEFFGVLSYSISLIVLFQVFGHMGLSGLIVRELVKNPKFNVEILGTTFILKTFGYIFSFTALVIYILCTEDTQSEQFWIVFFLSIGILFKPFNVIEFWFKSRLEAKYNFLAKTSVLTIVTIAKIILILTGSRIINFALAILFEEILLAISFVLLYNKKSQIDFKEWKFSPKRAKGLLSDSWKVFLGSLFAVIYLKIDQMMIKWFHGSIEVGLYSVASKISEVWYFIPTAIVMSLFPKLIDIHKTNSVLFKIRLQQIFDFLFTIGFVIAIMLTFISESLISILFGEAYVESVPILVIHLWGGVFIFMRSLLSKWILIENILIVSLITQGLGALTNIFLNYLFIPNHGGIGAAYATLISYAVASYFSLTFHPRTRPVFWMMTNSIFPFKRLFKINIKNK